MPRLFDPTDSYVSEADVTGEPSQFDQRGAEAQPQLPTPTEYETTREVRIEPFQPQQIAQEVRKPRSIMERMREVANSLVEPNPQTGMSGLEIFGSTLQDVGAAIDRRPGGNLERLRSSRSDELNQKRAQTLAVIREQRAQEQAASQKIERFMGLVKATDDPETVNRFLKAYAESDPQLKETFGHLLEGTTINPKSKKITLDREFGEGELTDPISKKPLPAGAYKVSGDRFVDGKFQPDSIEPSPTLRKEEAAEATERRFQQREERLAGEADIRHKENLAAQERMSRQFMAAQQGMESRHAASLASADAERKRLETSQEQELNSSHTALNIIHNYQSAHQDLMAGTKGKFSKQFQQGLALNAKAKTFAELARIAGTTPAEQQFAAEYNTVIGNLRSITPERQLSNEDALRNLQSFNPLATPSQLESNLTARTRSIVQGLTERTTRLKEQGKNVAGYEVNPERRYKEIKQRRPKATDVEVYSQMQREGY